MRSQWQGQRFGFCHADARFQQAHVLDCGLGAPSVPQTLAFFVK